MNNTHLTRPEVMKLLNVSSKVTTRIATNENWSFYKSDNQYHYLKDDVYKYIEKLNNIESNYMTKKDACAYLGYKSSSFSRLCKNLNWSYIEEKTIKYYKISDIQAYKEHIDLYNSDEYIDSYQAAIYYNLARHIITKLTLEYSIERLYKHGSPKYKKSDLDEVVKKYINNKVKKANTLKILKADKERLKLAEIQKNKIEEELLCSTHIKYKDALRYLDIGRPELDKLLTENKISCIKNTYIERDFIEKLYTMKQSFWSDKYTAKQARCKLSKILFEQLKKISIPLYAINKSTRTKLSYAYSQEEVSSKENLLNDPDKYGYISSTDAREVLDLKKAIFLKVVKEFNLSSISIVDNTKYYLKSDIYFLKEQQKDLGINYLTAKMAAKEYNSIRFLGRNLRGYKIPDFCKTSKFDGKEFCYKREDIEFYIKNSNLRNIFGDTEFDTFINRFNLLSDKLPLIHTSLYTKNKWLEFVETKLLASENSSNKTKYNITKSLLTCSNRLEALLSRNNETEIYCLSTKEINLWFLTVPNERNRIFLYQFLELVYIDIEFKTNALNSKSKGFKMKDIIKPDANSFNNMKKSLNFDSESIYSYEEYIMLFNHLINTNLHIERSLSSIESNNDISYLSCWLYLLIHLNNGWRHGDISRFPRLYLLDILDEWKINDLSWFKSNKISISQSRRVISRIIEYDFRISKTEVYGHFFCSDKLAPSISTAILMLECYYKHNFIGTPPKFDEPIMQFSSTQFNEPKEAVISKCIKGIQSKNFKFATRKMNRSILTYIYNIAYEISPTGYNALILPKYLRAHIDTMSTIEYIQFNSEQLEFLSGELFARGEFGFITDSLLNIISNKPSKSIVRTSEIRCVQNLFGNNDKIEATARMLNEFKDEKVEILNILNEKGFEECISIITNIYLGNMPSKSENIQCLFSKEGCRCPNTACEDCKYKIPSIYVLKTICNLVKEEMTMYMSTRHLGKKIKLSSKIHSHVDIILEAIRKYGQDYVYNCLDIDRCTFLQMFSSIDSVEELLHLKG